MKEQNQSRPKPPIEGNIIEHDGTFYPARFHAVPRAGELIDLFSFIEQADSGPPKRYYEVVQVVHKMYDAALNEGDKGHPIGWHFIEVLVKPSTSKFFKLAIQRQIQKEVIKPNTPARPPRPPTPVIRKC